VDNVRPADYEDVLVRAHAVHQLAQAIGVDELAAAVRANDLAESVGPILYSTLYQRRGDALREDREVLCAVRHLAGLGVREGTAAS
jgi:hypothetical protein